MHPIINIILFYLIGAEFVLFYIMYNAISHCIAKNISHVSTRRNKEKEGKKERGYKASVYRQIIYYIFYTLYVLHYRKCTLQVSTIECFLFLFENVKGGAYNCFHCFAIFRF